MNKLCDTVFKLALPVAEKIGLEIWDVEFVKEGGEHYLRVFIDKEGGVSIDDCEAFSRAFDKILDEEDPVDSSYIFEVSSAGLERRLTCDFHFKRYMGSAVVLKTFAPRNGKKEFEGVLSGYDGGDVTLSLDGAEETFEKKEIAAVRLRIEF